MTELDRRKFLLLSSSSLLSLATLSTTAQQQSPATAAQKTSSHCWLDVCGAFVVEDADLGVHSEIVLTSDTFVGPRGFEDGSEQTEYQIHLFQPDGTPVGNDGVAHRVTVPAMKTTVVKVADLIQPQKKFWGGLRVRLRPVARQPMHASDLFSSAFVRWKTEDSFDNVHANPDPLEWQIADAFFYSMPFPPLNRYDSWFSLFNPYTSFSKGIISIYDDLGVTLKKIPYELPPHASLLLDLNEGVTTDDAALAFRSRHNSGALVRAHASKAARGGTIAITNEPGSVKNFGYLVSRSEGKQRFSVEHPIHQQSSNPQVAPAPFDVEGRFKARNVLFTPLLFNAKLSAGLTLNSRFHLSSGAPIEEALWLSPLITDQSGSVAWQTSATTNFPASVPASLVEKGALKLKTCQSAILDCRDLSLPANFSGGLCLAVAPNTNHTLMKVELTVSPWNAHAFTHFRPGLRSARVYQQSRPRGGLSTDYIVTNARIETSGSKLGRDEIVCVINIDDKGMTGEPLLEIFSAEGLIERIKVGKVPPFGCTHFLLSDLVGKQSFERDLTLRLVDEQATMLMSAVHLDFHRKDIALDHGSDRFSTFQEFDCNV